MLGYAALALAAYALAVFGMWWAQRSFIYHPSPQRIDDGRMRQAGYAPFPVRTQDGLDLVAWRRPGDAHKPQIVLFHGNAQDASARLAIADQVAKHGYPVTLATYRGLGAFASHVLAVRAAR